MSSNPILAVRSPALLLPLLTAALIGCSVIFAQTRSELESNLSALKTQIQTLSARINHTQSQRDHLTSELRDSELEVIRWGTVIERTAHDLTAVQQRHQALNARREQVQGSLNAHRKALARYLRIGYVLGREHPLLWLLRQQSPAAISRLLTYQSYFSAIERKQILKTRMHLDELNTIDIALQHEQQRLTELRYQQQQAQQTQQQEQARRALLLVRINTKLRSDNTAQQRLDEEAKRLNSLITGIDVVLSDLRDERVLKLTFANRKGHLSWPISGQLKQAFKASSDTANLHHKGVLLQAPEGEIIHAIHRGRVAYADWLSGFGLLVILDHGQGYMSLYGHTARIIRDIGEWVNEGDPIALVGSTGGRGQSGLYFSIRHDGIANDPSRWCKPEILSG